MTTTHAIVSSGTPWRSAVIAIPAGNAAANTSAMSGGTAVAKCSLSISHVPGPGASKGRGGAVGIGSSVAILVK